MDAIVKAVYDKLPFLAQRILSLKDIRDVLKALRSLVSIEDVKEIVADCSNGTLDGISASKGGRAWLGGEWQLCELEALCILIRHEAGEGADGVLDLVARMKDFKNEQQ